MLKEVEVMRHELKEAHHREVAAIEYAKRFSYGRKLENINKCRYSEV